jgi:hypothetical protein
VHRSIEDKPDGCVCHDGRLLDPLKCSSLLRLLYASKRMPRHAKSSNRAGNRVSRSGKGHPSERETNETRRITRASANGMTDNETDQARAPGAPPAQRQLRMDQRTSEPLSQLDSIGSPSTTRGTPAASRRKAGDTPASSAYSAGSRHSATTDDDNIGDFSSQEASARKARRVSAQGKRPGGASRAQASAWRDTDE